MKNPFCFTTGDLVTIGLFAGAAKASSVMVALMGGGMNPVTLILKNAVWAALWMILLIKVQRPGTLTLANLLAALIGFFLLGSAMLKIPGLVGACIVAEIVMLGMQPIARRTLIVAVGIGLSELLTRAFSLGMSFLAMREQPMLMMVALVVVVIGYLGIIIGLFGGGRMVKELRHAGLIQN